MHPETPGSGAYAGHLVETNDKDDTWEDLLKDTTFGYRGGTGWAQSVDDDGNLFWFHHETGEARFVLDMGKITPPKPNP